MAITQDSRWHFDSKNTFEGYEQMHRVTCDFCGHVSEDTHGKGSDGAAEAARKAGWKTVFPSAAAPAKWKCPHCQQKS